MLESGMGTFSCQLLSTFDLQVCWLPSQDGFQCINARAYGASGTVRVYSEISPWVSTYFNETLEAKMRVKQVYPYR